MTLSRMERTRNSGTRQRLSRDELTVENLIDYGNCITDSTGCMKWLAARTKSGYGVLNLRNSRTQYAHRLIYELVHDERPECVMHTCDTPRCVRIEHLVGGTTNDNNQDMKRKQRYHNRERRATWDEVWLGVADQVAARSRCIRRAAGCVIVSAKNRIVATGFNGPPRHLVTNAIMMCDEFCPRATTKLEPASYDNCFSIHAEANALMLSNRVERESGVIYVTTAPCFDCAKLLANSGATTIKTRVLPQDWYRDPKKSLQFIMSSQVRVEILD